MPNSEDEAGNVAITERTIEEALRLLALEGTWEEALTSVLGNEGEEVQGDFSVHVVTFRDAGVLTYNAGVVLTLSTGAEFQLTIVRSAR